MSSDRPRGHRRSVRLPGYEYTQPGAYFVTLCVHDGECLFGDPVLRGVTEAMWQQIPRHFPHVLLDTFVVMPNHLHGIVIISDIPTAGARQSYQDASLTTLPASEADMGSVHESPLPAGAPAGSLGAIIGNFKSVTARRINQIRHMPAAPIWQRNYYEHIVRSERALNAIRQYIADNPLRWHLDKYNPQASGPDPLAADFWRLLQEE